MVAFEFVMHAIIFLAILVVLVVLDTKKIIKLTVKPIVDILLLCLPFAIGISAYLVILLLTPLHNIVAQQTTDYLFLQWLMIFIFEVVVLLSFWLFIIIKANFYVASQKTTAENESALRKIQSVRRKFHFSIFLSVINTLILTATIVWIVIVATDYGPTVISAISQFLHLHLQMPLTPENIYALTTFYLLGLPVLIFLWGGLSGFGPIIGILAIIVLIVVTMGIVNMIASIGIGILFSINAIVRYCGLCQPKRKAMLIVSQLIPYWGLVLLIRSALRLRRFEKETRISFL
jgi:hypothetical protein